MLAGISSCAASGAAFERSSLGSARDGVTCNVGKIVLEQCTFAFHGLPIGGHGPRTCWPTAETIICRLIDSKEMHWISCVCSDVFAMMQLMRHLHSHTNHRTFHLICCSWGLQVQVDSRNHTMPRLFESFYKSLLEVTC